MVVILLSQPVYKTRKILLVNFGSEISLLLSFSVIGILHLSFLSEVAASVLEYVVMAFNVIIILSSSVLLLGLGLYQKYKQRKYKVHNFEENRQIEREP